MILKSGYSFPGQFIDHDLTLDTSSSLEQQIDVNATRNFRAPARELDSLQGLGPAARPFIDDRDNPFRFLLSPNKEDLPRNENPRRDGIQTRVNRVESTQVET